MPFVLKKYNAIKGKKIQLFLIQDLKYNIRYAQKLVCRGRVFDENNISYNMSDYIKNDEIFVGEFEGISRGLAPIYEGFEFALFDKPTNLMVHPISKNTPYSLLDEVRYFFGNNSNLVHRIDAETSGLVLVAKNKKTEIELKSMFEEKKYKKSYLCIVRGEVKEKQLIDKALDKEGLAIGVRMKVCDDGKSSQTYIEPIKYNKEKDLTLLKVNPITGRQHQIRIHLHSIGHTILGDPIYGIDDVNAEKYLNKELSDEERIKVTGSNRLWLQANYLEFVYKGIIYKFYSKQNDIKEFFK